MGHCARCVLDQSEITNEHCSCTPYDDTAYKLNTLQSHFYEQMILSSSEEYREKQREASRALQAEKETTFYANVAYLKYLGLDLCVKGSYTEMLNNLADHLKDEDKVKELLTKVKARHLK